MTATIFRLDGAEAYDLIFTDHLAMLPPESQETMHRSMVNSSRVWLGADDSKVMAIWGLIPPTLMSDTAYLWLFTTAHLAGHEFMFIRHSKRAIEAALQEFPTIVGHCEVTNLRAQQWLRWLGASFGDPVFNKVLPFTIKASQQWQPDSVQSA